MVDSVSKEIRSRIMASVRRQNTGPELIVRSTLHNLGYRFRLHPKNLAGTPDIVLPRYRSVIFVHGCFWHQHKGCHLAKRPTSNIEYWNRKLDENIERDKSIIKGLKKSGWKILIIWQCETNEIVALEKKLRRFLK